MKKIYNLTITLLKLPYTAKNALLLANICDVPLKH